MFGQGVIRYRMSSNRFVPKHGVKKTTFSEHVNLVGPTDTESKSDQIIVDSIDEVWLAVLTLYPVLTEGQLLHLIDHMDRHSHDECRTHYATILHRNIADKVIRDRLRKCIPLDKLYASAITEDDIDTIAYVLEEAVRIYANMTRSCSDTTQLCPSTVGLCPSVRDAMLDAYPDKHFVGLAIATGNVEMFVTHCRGVKAADMCVTDVTDGVILRAIVVELARRLS